MGTAEAVTRGRDSFRRRAWGDAYAALSAAEAAGALAAEDLERLAMAAHLVGRDAESRECWIRAHREFLGRGEVPGAARCAFWLAFGLLLEGEPAASGGWLARGRRLLDGDPRDCVERGYLLVPVGLRQLHGERDAAATLATSRQVVAIAERFGDVDLLMHGRVLEARALIRGGQAAEGVALLDEAMVAVTADEVSPVVAGLAYCAMVEVCIETFDLWRAQEWTAALSRWCEEQPDLVPYRGQCLVHRAEVLQLRGDWSDAMEEAERACERLDQTAARSWVGSAYYQQAELHRLRGEFEAAERAYAEANEWGWPPHPGLALLRLAQGRSRTAAAAIRRALDEAADGPDRTRLLPAYVEVMLAAGDPEAARAGADALRGIAARMDSPYLHALAAQATGSVLLLEGETQAGCASLREALVAWEGLDAPYEAARARALLARGYRALGDVDGASMEEVAARSTFRRLGAAADLRRLEAEAGVGREAAGGLTAREVEVLRLVASGKTNREVASDLVVSEHTVRRHLQNVFAKIGVSSRAAATAFAVEHDLV